MNPNIEKSRKLRVRLERAGERITDWAYEVKQEMRHNIKVLDFQQQLQRRTDVDEHNNLGFKDFSAVKGHFDGVQVQYQKQIKKLARLRSRK